MARPSAQAPSPLETRLQAPPDSLPGRGTRSPLRSRAATATTSRRWSPWWTRSRRCADAAAGHGGAARGRRCAPSPPPSAGRTGGAGGATPTGRTGACASARAAARQYTDRRLGKDASRWPPGASRRAHWRSISSSCSRYSITLDMTINCACPASSSTTSAGNGSVCRRRSASATPCVLQALARAGQHRLAAVDRDRPKAVGRELLGEVPWAAAQVHGRRPAAAGGHHPVDGGAPQPEALLELGSPLGVGLVGAGLALEVLHRLAQRSAPRLTARRGGRASPAPASSRRPRTR